LRRIIVFLTALFLLYCLLACAKPVPTPISQQIRSFSPMAQIYLNHLGLADRNGNGVIEQNANEGYEAFTAKYGKADVGFFINGITQGANNGKLEENEIVNNYYLKHWKHRPPWRAALYLVWVTGTLSQPIINKVIYHFALK